MKKNIRKVKRYKKLLICLIGILILLVGISIGKLMNARADEINYEYQSNNIEYNNTNNNLNATNVKDAIDELYEKVGQCPSGYNCLTDEEFLTTGSKILQAYTYDENSCVTGNETACEKTTCYSSKTSGSCPVGTIIDYFVNDTTKVRFHVLHDDGDTITMQSQRNSIYNTEWSVSSSDSSYGPQNIMSKLKTETDSWTNVNPITITSATTSFIGVDSIYNSCKSEFEGHVTCSENRYDIGLIAETYRARMITMQEAMNSNIGQCLPRVSNELTNAKSCRMFMNNYLYAVKDDADCRNTSLCVEDNHTENGGDRNWGYWTMSVGSNWTAWYVSFAGFVNNNYQITGIAYGARAVVVVNK